MTGMQTTKMQVRWCPACRRHTEQLVRQVRAGSGRVLVDPAECLWHREWVGGESSSDGADGTWRSEDGPPVEAAAVGLVDLAQRAWVVAFCVPRPWVQLIDDSSATI